MRRMSKKVMGVVCMAMAIFCMTTCDVKVSAAGFYYPTSQPQKVESDTNTTTKDNTTTQGKTFITKEKTTTSSSSYLTSEQQSVLNKLDTDYSKVRWDVQYSPKGMDGIIISVSSYMEGKYPYLLVAFTNIYNQDVTVSAEGYAKGKSGQEVGDIFIYEEAIRPGNTVTKAIYCDSTPTGEIHWDTIEMPKVYGTSTYWEGDWTFTTDADGYYKLDYSLKADDYMTPGYVTALLLDANGYIVDVAYDYNIDKGYSGYGSIDFYTKEFNSKVVDVAMFANPLKEK